MRRAAPLLLALLLAACGGAEIIDPPAPLPEGVGEAPLAPRWRLTLAGEGEGLRLRPAAGDGQVYVAEPAGRVRAVDPARGRIRWERDLGIALSAGVGLGEGLVAVAGSEGEVVVLAAADGTERWRAQVGSEVLAPPIVAGGRVLVRSVDGRLTTLDAADGRRLWTQAQPVPALSLRGTSAPVPAGDHVVAGFANGRVAAYRLVDGVLVWETRLATPRGATELERMVDVDADPLVTADTVYAAAYQGRVAALARTSGTVLWTRRLSVWAGLALDGGRLYAADAAGVVWALDAAGGAALWRQEALRNRRLAGPVLFAGLLWVGDLEGWVHAVDPADGSLRGRVRATDGPVRWLTPGAAGLLVQGVGEVVLLAPRRGD